MQHRQPASPRLGFGCVRLGSVRGGRSWRADVRLVQEAIDRGVTLFDTADVYGNGVSERIIGRAVRGRRDSVEIATKVGYLFDERSLFGQSVSRLAVPLVDRAKQLRARPSAGGARGHDGHTAGGVSYACPDFSPAHMIAAVDASLQRLGTDYIDVLQLHGPRSVLDDAADTANELVRAGKARRFGIGAESIDVAGAWVVSGSISVVQLPFGVLDPQASDRVFDEATDRGVELWVRGVLGGGVLAESTADPASITDHPKSALVASLIELASREGISVFQLAIDYARSFAAVSTILLGIHSSAHLSANTRLFAAPPIGHDVIEEARALVTQWVTDHERS